jgi:hypothetical protein
MTGAKTREDGESRVLLGRIDGNVGDPSVGKASGDQRPIRSAVGGHLDVAVARADVDHLEVGFGLRDGRNGGKRSLIVGQLRTDGAPCIAAVRGSIQPVCPKVECRRARRTHHEWRYEERRVVQVDAVKHPAVRASADRSLRSRELASPLALGVARRRSHYVDCRKAPVAAEEVSPNGISGVKQRAVILRPAQGRRRVGRMERDARIELRNRDIGVERRPGPAGVGGFIDPAVVSGIDHVRVRRTEGERMPRGWYCRY